MKAALIIMTILGCDDSATQCHYISTVEGSWQTVALCDNESQKQLPKFSNNNYPVIVAVCETAGKDMTAAAEAQPQPQAEPKPVETRTAEVPPVPVETAPQPLPKRALAFIANALPDTTRLRDAVTAPVHYAEDGYSWVVRKFAK